MNQITIIGNIGQDAIIRDHNGQKSINFHVAVNRSYKDKDNVKVEKTDWFACTYWKREGQSAEISKYLLAGTQVMIQGEPSSRAYQSKKDNQWYSSLEVNVQTLQLLGAKKADGSQPANNTPTPQASNQEMPGMMPNANFDNNGNDDLPF